VIAYVVESANGPFREVHLPQPVPREGEVLVRISASAINPLDTKIRAGQAAHAKQPLPAVLGLDMAGVVESVGPRVSRFLPGDEVYGMAGGVGGLQGTLAETISVDAALLAHKPKTLTMREAAALPLVTITAWEGLVDQCNVRTGETVLIHGGTGGVGYASVQIALARGAKVYATVSQEKRLLMEELGVTPIDRFASVADYVAEHTAGQGFDVVYDTVGGTVLDASFVAVRRYTGHVVSCLGWGTHALAPLSFRSATYSGVFTLYPLLSGHNRAHHGEILAEATKLADNGQLKPFLSKERFGHNEIAEAFDSVTRGSNGKVVVEF